MPAPQVPPGGAGASRARALAGISRAPFLALPVTLVAAGAAAGRYDTGGFSWPRTLVALLGLVAAHVGVNALNEAGDMRSGIDLRTRRTPFSGGSGTLPAGLLGVRTATLWGLGATALAALCGLQLVVETGPVLLPLVLAGAFLVLSYTPLLARSGLGELGAGLGLGLLPVLGVALIQGGRGGPAAWSAGLPAGLMTFNLLLLNEFPDEQADRAGGRRNLVLLLGRGGAARVYAVAALLVPLWIGGAVLGGWLPPPALFAAAPTLLLLPALRWAFTGAAADPPLPALGANVAWNLLTNAALALVLALA